MTFRLTLAEAQHLARTNRIVSQVQTLYSSSETPLAVYEKLTDGRPGTFLLESADQGVWSRYSFVGVNSRGTLLKQSGEAAKWISPTGVHPLSNSGEQLENLGLPAIDQLVKSWATESNPHLPPLTSGLVGMIGWDAIREIESLEAPKVADYLCPQFCFTMFEDLVVLDHLTGELLLVANIFVTDSCNIEHEFAEATRRIDQMRRRLLQPSKPFISELNGSAEGKTKSRSHKPEFLEAVKQAKQRVAVGDVFQVVLSQRFDEPTVASPIDTYRVLRSINPSPYMYLLNLADDQGQFAIVGSSPEALFTLNESKAVMHPIAGSRPRGKSTDQDNELAEELLDDAKETAEHLMLVDLARNDLLKVCTANSVEVTEFMQIRRFSHIMHLVSTVEGNLSTDCTAVDLFRATFPAGTLSGAPKPKALEIIEQLEPANRGLFGGVVGYFDFAGNADLAIAIRTAFIRDGVARVQAGAGIVLDSVAESEFDETVNKAKATLRSIAVANQMRAIHD